MDFLQSELALGRLFDLSDLRERLRHYQEQLEGCSALAAGQLGPVCVRLHELIEFRAGVGVAALGVPFAEAVDAWRDANIYWQKQFSNDGTGWKRSKNKRSA